MTDKERRHEYAWFAGLKVRLNLGPRVVPATVVEDRGNVGAGGRHLLRVELDDEPGTSFEVPADSVTTNTADD